MDHDVRVASDWWREMSVQRNVECIVMVLGFIRQHASTEVLSVLHTHTNNQKMVLCFIRQHASTEVLSVLHAQQSEDGTRLHPTACQHRSTERSTYTTIRRWYSVSSDTQHNQKMVLCFIWHTTQSEDGTLLHLTACQHTSTERSTYTY